MAATYWGGRVRQLITGCWSPGSTSHHITSLWSPMPRCDLDTRPGSHYQMSLHCSAGRGNYHREGHGILGTPWLLLKEVLFWSEIIGVVTSVVFYGSHHIDSHLSSSVSVTPLPGAPEIMHWGWHVMIYISPNIVFLQPVPSVMCSCEARVRVKRVRGDKNLDWPWGN